MSAPALEVAGLAVRFGRVDALAGVSLSVAGGAVVGLVGPNGAGKTTLLDAVAGLTPLAAGRVLVGGEDVTAATPAARARRGLVRTFQGVDLFADLTAGEHLRVAAEAVPGRRRAAVAAAVAWAAAAAGCAGLEATPPAELRHDQRKAVGLGRALATLGPPGARTVPGAVVLDEPFAGLDRATRAAVAGRLRALAALGAGVLVADHDLDLVLDLCDEVVVLDFGRVVARGTPAAVRADTRVQEAYLGRAGPSAPGGPPVPVPPTGPELLRCRGLTAGYGGPPVVAGVDLDVAEGEVVALLGPNGAGKTTTLGALAGLVRPSGGRVSVVGTALPAPAAALARRGLALVPQDRGVLPSLTVAENLRLVRGAAGAAGADPVGAALEVFPVLEALLGRRAGLLSGGEQHLVALARAVAARPRLLLVDELSLGLAPAAARAALRAVAALAAGGAGVVVVEQHPALALELASRAYVLDRGRVGWQGPAADLAARPGILEAAYLGEAPSGE